MGDAASTAAVMCLAALLRRLPRMSAIPRPDAFDPRLVLRAYAWVFAGLGVLCGVLGPFWRAGEPTDPLYTMAVRTSGWLMIAGSCAAIGLDGAGSREKRRRGLGWFAVAHVVLAIGGSLALVRPSRAGIVDRPATTFALSALTVLAFVLCYAWSTTEGDAGSSSVFSWRRRRGAQPATDAGETPAGVREARAIAQQEERNRLARDLHDSVKQQVFAINASAATAEARMASDPAGAREAIVRVRASAREAMTELEAMLDQLRAVPLELTSLVGALRKQTDAFQSRTGVPVHVTVGELPADDVLLPGAAHAAFRVAQEALANVARHARATRVELSIAHSDSGMTLMVRDNGSGFDAAGSASGMGLANMRSRAAEAGGQLNVTSRAGETVVTVTMPLVAVTLRHYRREALRRAVTTVLWLGVFLALAVWNDLELFGVSIVIMLACIAIARNVFVYARTGQGAGA